MAAPNLVNIATITAKSVQALLTTSQVSILENPASSGKVFKINSILAGNIDGTLAATVNVSLDKAGTVLGHFSTIAVPPDSTMILIDRNTAIYLEEDDEIKASASAVDSIDILINYEELS